MEGICDFPTSERPYHARPPCGPRPMCAYCTYRLALPMHVCYIKRVLRIIPDITIFRYSGLADIPIHNTEEQTVVTPNK